MMRRMLNREWPGQTFFEALGQTWNLEKNQNFDKDDPCCDRARLIFWVLLANAFDMLWWCFGIIELNKSEPALIEAMPKREDSSRVPFEGCR